MPFYCFIYVYREQILPALNLWEFYGVDVNKVVNDFKDALLKKVHALKNTSTCVSPDHAQSEVKIIQDPVYKRLGNTIDIKTAINWYFANR